MRDVINEILKWPAIVQGALGSALFWAILTGGTAGARKIGFRARGFSRTRKLTSLRTELLRYRAVVRQDDPGYSAMVLSVLIYSAIHYLVKALACICLGLLFGSMIPLFGTVGFIMALYYLVWAAEAVRDTKPGLDHQKRIAELEEKIAKLKQTV